MSRWGGRHVMTSRARWVRQLPVPCLRCGEPVWPHDEWHIGHKIPRSVDPALALDPANQWPEHASCNTSAGATVPAPRTPVSRRPW